MKTERGRKDPVLFKQLLEQRREPKKTSAMKQLAIAYKQSQDLIANQ